MKAEKGQISIFEICDKVMKLIAKESAVIESQRIMRNNLCLDCNRHYVDGDEKFTIVINDNIDNVRVRLTYVYTCSNMWQIEQRFEQMLSNCGFEIAYRMCPS